LSERGERRQLILAEEELLSDPCFDQRMKAWS